MHLNPETLNELSEDARWLATEIEQRLVALATLKREAYRRGDVWATHGWRSKEDALMTVLDALEQHVDENRSRAA